MVYTKLYVYVQIGLLENVMVILETNDSQM